MSDKLTLRDHMHTGSERLYREVVLETLRFEAAETLKVHAPAGSEADAEAVAKAIVEGLSYGTILQMRELGRWTDLLMRVRAEAFEERRVRAAAILYFNTHQDVVLLTRNQGTYTLTTSQPSRGRTSGVLTVQEARMYLQEQGLAQAYIDMATDPEAWPDETPRNRSWFWEHLK